MSNERRLAPRYEISADVTLDGGETATMVNLSSSGVYFETDRPARTGQEISLVLPFKYAMPTETRVTCRAYVVRVDDLGDRLGVAATYEPVGIELSDQPV